MCTSLRWCWRYSPHPDVRFGFLVVLVFSLGCGAGSTEPAPVVRTIDAPKMLISGCRVRTETSCERLVLPGQADVKLWLDLASTGHVNVKFNGEVLAFSSEPAERGVLLTLSLPVQGGRLSMDGVEPSWKTSVDLEVSWRLPLAVYLTRQAVSYGVPLRVLLGLLRLASAFEESPRSRVDILKAIRSISERLGRYRLSRESAAAGAELSRVNGFSRDYAELTLIEAFDLERSGQLASSRRAVESVRAVPNLPEDLGANVSYHQGLLEMGGGDFAAAAREFEAAMRAAERLRLDLLFFSALQMLAISASELGDEQTAVALIERGLGSLHLLDHDCENQAKTLGNLGWALLRLPDENASIDRARRSFSFALQASMGECPDEGRVNNQRVNLALASLLDWELDEALFRVAELRSDASAGTGVDWVDAIDARARHLSGRGASLPSPLVTPLRTPHSPFLAWDAAVLRGDRLRAAGLSTAAVEDYESAELILAEASKALGVAIAQESFLARRDESLEGLLASLLDVGRISDAVCRARLAMRRTLLKSDRAARIGSLDSRRREAWNDAMLTYLQAQEGLALDARNDWKHEVGEVVRRRSARVEALSRAETTLTKTLRTLLGSTPPEHCEDLPPLPEGQALLVGYFGTDESILLVASEAGFRWSRGPSPEDDYEGWARDVLGPLRLENLDVEAIRLLITGRGHALPWPSLPVGGRQLVDVAALEWGLDLPKQEEQDWASTAVVVGDPTGDLPEARAEAETAARSLRTARWSVEHLERDDARAKRVRELMSSVSLAYFAGHGRRSEEAGGGLGWSDALVLADGQLTVPEILGFEQVPPRIIVAGCDSGTTSETGLSGGLNVGRAFLLSGAEEVLVASGKADDAEARMLGNAVAKTVAEEPSMSLAQALQAAQLRLRDERPGSSWWQYRVLVR